MIGQKSGGFAIKRSINNNLRRSADPAFRRKRVGARYSIQSQQ